MAATSAAMQHTDRQPCQHIGWMDRLLRRLLRCRWTDPALDVGFDNTEGGLVPLDGHHQGLQHPFRREKVGDDPLGDGNRHSRHTERLRVESEVDDQFFRRARHEA